MAHLQKVCKDGKLWNMEFPIKELLDHKRSVEWITQHFHLGGLKCPSCGGTPEQARVFRRTKRSQLRTYRCQVCQTPYNLYTGTVFQQHHLSPQQVVLLMRGICKGKTTTAPKPIKAPAIID